MTIAKGWKEAKDGMRAMVDKATGMIADLQARIADTSARLHRAEHDPVTRADMKARARAKRQQDGDSWLERYGNTFVHGDQALGSPCVAGSARLPWSPNEPIPYGALCAGAPEFVDRLMDNLIDRLDYQEGLRLSDRPSAIATLRRELDALRSEEDRMIREANEAGLEDRRAAHLCRRWNLRGRVRSAPRVFASHERPEAAAAVPDPDHVGGVAPRS